MNYSLSRMKKWHSIVLIVFSLVLGHFTHFSLSPRGVHVWRQCNTLAVAQNFHEEQLDIRYPRVDHRKHTSGVTGMSFPLTEQLIAYSYFIFGKQHINHRIVQFFIFLIGLLGLYALIHRLFRSTLIASVSCFFYAWSPEMYYHSVNAIPDVAAMTAIIWCLYFYLGKKPANTVVSMVLLGLAALVKFQYLLFGPVLFVHTLSQQYRGKAAIIAFLGLFIGGVSCLWYIHAAQLRNLNHLYDFGLFVNSVDSVSEMWRLLKNNLIMDIPEQLLGYGGFILALLGLTLFMLKLNKVKLLVLLTTAICFGFYHFKELKQMEFHAYYMMPYILLAILLIAYGLHKLPQRLNVWFLLVPLILVQVFHTIHKINPRYLDQNSGLAEEFLNPTQLEEMRDFGASSHKAVVGPDPSACIYFYYLGVKGWNVASQRQLKDKEEVAQAILEGKADVLIVQQLSTENKAYYRSLFKLEKQVGNFTLFKERLLQ